MIDSMHPSTNQMSSVRIPPVSDEFLVESCHFLGELSFEQGVLRVYWWTEHRQVIFHALWMLHWWIQFDERINDALSQILGLSCDDFRVDDLWIRDTPNSDERIASDNEKSDFLSCEWSDYSCDRMKIRANISIGDRDLDRVRDAEPPIAPPQAPSQESAPWRNRDI